MRCTFALVSAAVLATSAMANPVGPPAPYAPAPYKEEPKPYAYAYAVKDDYSGSNFNAQENADGKNQGRKSCSS